MTSSTSAASKPHATLRAAAPRTTAGAGEASFANRVASLIYGTLIYVLFLGTFLYTIGFVTGLVVPKTVDGGAPAPLVEALLVNGAFLAAFAVQHTVMARKAFKRWWTRIVPKQIERSTFVLTTCAILVPMFVLWRQVPGEPLWSVDGPIAMFLHGMSFFGWGVVLLSTFLIDHFELFGLSQVVRHFLGKPTRSPEFRERSLYRHVRHPLMLGFLVAFWATPVMSMGHLFFAAMCTAYILVGIQIEERTLVAEHGDSYRAYKRRVPMLLPTGRRG